MESQMTVDLQKIVEQSRADIDPEVYATAMRIKKEMNFPVVDIRGHQVVLLEPGEEYMVDSPTFVCVGCNVVRAVPDAIMESAAAKMYLLGWYDQFECDGVTCDDQNL